jgi:hypothetical protein
LWAKQTKLWEEAINAQNAEKLHQGALGNHVPHVQPKKLLQKPKRKPKKLADEIKAVLLQGGLFSFIIPLKPPPVAVVMCEGFASTYSIAKWMLVLTFTFEYVTLLNA